MIEGATMLIAAGRRATLQAEARQRALVRLASCCGPTALRRAITAWKGTVTWWPTSVVPEEAASLVPDDARLLSGAPPVRASAAQGP
jgi:hypothetical protein